MGYGLYTKFKIQYTMRAAQKADEAIKLPVLAPNPTSQFNRLCVARVVELCEVNMNEIRLRAYAKVNLGLDVLRRREDGYHDVRMVMQNINLFDKIFIKRRKETGISVKSNLSYLPNDKGNLAYRAAALLMDEFNVKDGVEIELYKFIPVAAGMAGGSADAAAVLYGINKLFRLGLDLAGLMERGVSLGADIPYCLMGGTVLAEGIGEKLTRLKDCPDCYFVVAKPPFSVSTKLVYEKLVLDEKTVHPDIDGIMDAINDGDVRGIAGKLSNVLETVTAVEYPDIEGIKDKMRECGALNALMSGSGPTVFGIFDNKEKAERCNQILRQDSRVKTAYVAENCSGGFEARMEEHYVGRQ